MENLHRVPDAQLRLAGTGLYSATSNLVPGEWTMALGRGAQLGEFGALIFLFEIALRASWS